MPNHPLDDSSEIIVRVNGEYDVTVPELPSQEGDGEGAVDGGGDEGVEGERESKSHSLLSIWSSE